MKKVYLLLSLFFFCAITQAQQVIGTFPQMDGGYENQTAGLLVSTTIATGVQRTDWTVQNTTGSRTITVTGGRSGPKYVTFGATGGRRLQSPTAADGAVVNTTAYIIQYYYKTPTGTAPTTGQAGSSPDGTGTPGTYVATPLVGTSGVWTKATTAITSGTSAASPKYGIGVIRFSGASTVDIDVDDFVMYAGATADVTAANSPGTVSVTNPTSTTLDVSWIAASGGEDGGGYVVVRYAAIPGANDDPNQNGIYAVGNTVTGGVNGTVVYVGTGLSFTDIGLAGSTTYYYKVYTVDKAFNYSGESEGNGTTTVAGVPDIVLSSPNPAVTAGNIVQGSTNNAIYRFDLAVTTADATLNGVTVTTAGTYAATDITNLKCWYSADAVFSPGTDVLLSTKVAGLGAGAQVFPSFTNQPILSGNTGYIFISADLPCAAVVANNISVDAITTADISFVSGNKSGTAFAGGLQTIIAATPNDVTVPAASVLNASSSLSWVNPTGCYDEVLIVARAGIANDGIPTGDGSAYTGNLVFGTGTALGGGFVVYKGAVSPQVVTGLTNGTAYFYKFFTRFGTTWTAGVEVSATPAVVTAPTDYFRSVAPGGDWGNVATWESSPDNGVTPWIPATLVPTAAANTITIRNTANVTVAAAADGDQVVVEAGATLTLGAAFTLADGAGTDLSVDGTVVNTAGTHIFTGTTAFNAGTLYQHNRNGGTIIPATWALTSTCEVIGNTTSTTLSGGVNQAFGNFTWNSAGQTITLNLVGQLSTVNGNFRVQNVGSGTLRLTGSAALNLTVGGNYIVEANNDIDNNATEVTNISIGGNFTHTAGTFQSSVDVATITMTGAGTTFTQSGGTFTSTNLNWIIAGGASVTLANNLPLATTRSVLVTGTLDAAALQITGAGDVTVNGTLRTAHADGLELTGTLANSGTKTLGAASTVDYYAAGAQIFSNRIDYANVIINGGGNKTLNGNAILSGNLTLTNGYVISTVANLMSLTNTASVSGASNTSYVNGPLKKTGNTNFTFPLGKIGFGYVPLDISNFVGGTTADEFTAEYVRGNARLLGPITAGPGLDHVSGCDYWTLDKGIATPTSVDLKLFWSANNICNGTYIDDLPSLTMAHFDGAGWNSFPVSPILTGGSTTVAGSITWPTVTVFSPFSLASSTFGLNPLPIVVNYFTGTKQNTNHLLNWKVTCNSTPGVTMELLRSTDGRNFSGINTIFATALQCQQPFNYTDVHPLPGVNYYRLKMTDANGKVTYSSIVSLINAAAGIDIMSIAPNPIVNRNFKLNISAAQKTQMDMMITDMQGRVMQKQTINAIAGFNTVPVNVSNLATGTYQVYVVSAEGRSKVLRFVIQ